MLREDDVIHEFAKAMQEQGIAVDPSDIVADGEFHRIHVIGDPPKVKNGFYVLHFDDRSAGVYGCNKRYGHDAKFTWASKNPKPLSAEEKRAFRERMERQKAEREAAKKRAQEAAAQHAVYMWDKAAECSGDDHPYLKRKGVQSHGLRVGAWEILDHDTAEVIVVSDVALLIPIRDTKKNIHSMQAIMPDAGFNGRDKDYLKNGAKEGNFYSLGKPQAVEYDGRQRTLIMIGEGYATVASAHEATGHAGIVAFDAPNILPVAKILRQRFPDALFLFLADNDQWTLTPVENPGLTRAREAVEEVGGLIALPPFTDADATVGEDGKKRGPTDFNDLQQLRGVDAVRATIMATLAPAPAEPEPVPDAEATDDVPPWEDLPPAEPGEGPPPEPELQELPGPVANGHFTILGYDRGTYYIFQHSKSQIIKYTKGDISEIGLIALAPLNWWEFNFAGEGRAKIDTKAAAEFIIRTAERRGVFDPEKIRGRGAWLDEGRVVYHHGSRLSVAGESMHVAKIKSQYVYEMAQSMPLPADEMMTNEEGQKLIDVLKMFRWGVNGSALIFAGWLALAPVCGAIPWRPHIWMTGGAGSGKSSLAKFGHSLLKGTDVFAQGNSSEAGIRQRLRADALPVIMDESESNEEGDAKRIQSILALIRQASTESDAETLKGTTDGSGMTYHIRSMFCLASIQVALKHKADIDRLTVLTLKSSNPNDASSGGEWAQMREAMYQLAGREDSMIQRRLLRRCIDLLPTTLKNIEVFSTVGADVFGSQRHGDQYGALLAGAWSLVSTEVATAEQARQMFSSYNWQELRDDHDADESQRALQALMEAHVRVKGGVELTVYELVKAASGHETGIAEINEITADAILQRHGMRLKSGYLVMANGSKELGRLMQGSAFEADWRGVLLRIPGADKNDNKAERFSGVPTKCIRIPMGPVVGEKPQPAAEPAF